MILSGVRFETFTLFVENDVIMTEDGSEDTPKLVITLGNFFCVCNIEKKSGKQKKNPP
jgi:hypothetical protein